MVRSRLIFSKKSTHTDRYLNFCFCHPISQKRGTIKTLMKRLSPTVSDKKSRKQEQQSIPHFLERNGYPSRLISQNISETEPIQFNSRKQTSSTKLPVGFVSLTYIPGLTEKLKRILNNFDIKVGMKPANTLKYYFNTKDSTPLKLSITNTFFRLPDRKTRTKFSFFFFFLLRRSRWYGTGRHGTFSMVFSPANER